MVRRSGQDDTAPTPLKPWQSASEKVMVAGVTALATAMVTVGVPTVVPMLFSQSKAAGFSKNEVEFQKTMWLENAQCLADPAPLWHDSRNDRQMDATVCPDTGDILVQMRDKFGKQAQFWADLTPLNKQFDGAASRTASIGDLLIGRAYAAPVGFSAQATPAATQLAQTVLCQKLFDDGRLRRRIVNSPGQCIEIVINTNTGQVISQRPIPCVPDCAVDA